MSDTFDFLTAIYLLSLNSTTFSGGFLLNNHWMLVVWLGLFTHKHIHSYINETIEFVFLPSSGFFHSFVGVKKSSVLLHIVVHSFLLLP